MTAPDFGLGLVGRASPRASCAAYARPPNCVPNLPDPEPEEPRPHSGYNASSSAANRA